jgi:hypothetical protein
MFSAIYALPCAASLSNGLERQSGLQLPHELGKIKAMSVIQQIEEAVRQLSAEDRAAFRAWYAEFDAEDWDRQLEADVSAGRLDWLIDEARRDLREGRCSER